MLSINSIFLLKYCFVDIFVEQFEEDLFRTTFFVAASKTREFEHALDK